MLNVAINQEKSSNNTERAEKEAIRGQEHSPHS